jgi:hypothetical protein
LKKLHSQGKSNREIAKELKVHHRTIAYYLLKNNMQCNTANQPIDMVSDVEARCKKCSKIKSINEFQFGRKGQKYEYKFSYCNECRKKQLYLNLNNDVEKFLGDRFNRLKQRAKKQGILFTISKKEFITQYHNQNGLCFYTDVELICKVGSLLHRNSLSADKLIPEKGYCVGNVVFTTHRINTCKCDLPLNEIQKWMPLWYNKIIKFMMNNSVMPQCDENQ